MMDNSIYTEVEKYVAVSLTMYRNRHPELWEDALQECLIQAWRDVEDGVSPKIKLLRRAALAGKRFYQANGEKSFGKPKTSREGIRQDSTTLNKVMVFVDEFRPVHNRMPTGKEVREALGIKQGAATLALKHIREGSIDHMKYHVCADGSNRKDNDYYSTTSIESLGQDSMGLKAATARTWEENPDTPFFGVNWEVDTVGRMDVINLLKKLSPHYRKVMYLYLFEQYNTGDIGRELGHIRTPSQLGSKALKGALNQIEIITKPYSGKCRGGHTRTSENTTVKRAESGVYSRYCSICKKKSGGHNKRASSD